MADIDIPGAEHSEVLRLLDTAMRDLQGRELVSTDEMGDMILDIRQAYLGELTLIAATSGTA